MDYNIFIKKTIDEFIYPNSINLFKLFVIKTSFLYEDPHGTLMVMKIIKML